MSACLILDVTDSDQWPAAPGVHPSVGTVLLPTTMRIPVFKRPTVIHESRAIAEAEALRLAREHPHSRFALFETSVVAVASKVPTHITLGGQVVAESYVPALAEVGEDDGIPF